MLVYHFILVFVYIKTNYRILTHNRKTTCRLILASGLRFYDIWGFL